MYIENKMVTMTFEMSKNIAPEFSTSIELERTRVQAFSREIGNQKRIKFDDEYRSEAVGF